jgi:hypothetical protein
MQTYQIISIITSITIFVIGILIAIIGYFVKTNIKSILETIVDFRKDYKKDFTLMTKEIKDNAKDNEASHEKLWIDVNANKSDIAVLKTQKDSMEKKIDEILRTTTDMNQHYIAIQRSLK